MQEQLNNEAQPLKAGLNEGAAKRMAQLVEMGKSQLPATNTSGMTCGSQVVVGPIKSVDSKTLAGSYPGDHRAKGADAVLPSNPGPREQMGQFPLSSRTPAAPKPFSSSTEGSEGDRA